MSISDLIKIIEKKYGEWHETDAYFYNCVQTRFSNSIYLNVIFFLDKTNSVLWFLKNNNCETKNIKNFYSECNGLTFFNHSLVIYGYCKVLEKGYIPLDAEMSNRNISIKNKNWDKHYISIGEYSNYAFCLKRNDSTGLIYVVNKNNNLIKRSFLDLEELINYCVSEIFM